ncbi:carboxymuconolactone decarboxylase family protein [soil metagenome]
MSNDHEKDAASPSARFERGMALKREVLGGDYVDAAWADAQKDDFAMAIQQMMTETGWGTVWGRPGLDVKTRLMLNLAMLTALNRPHELAIHLKGALRNGVTRDEVREILIHTGPYCGWPASLDAIRVARRVIAELDAMAAEAGASS